MHQHIKKSYQAAIRPRLITGAQLQRLAAPLPNRYFRWESIFPTLILLKTKTSFISVVSYLLSFKKARPFWTIFTINVTTVWSILYRNRLENADWIKHNSKFQFIYLQPRFLTYSVLFVYLPAILFCSMCSIRIREMNLKYLSLPDWSQRNSVLYYKPLSVLSFNYIRQYSAWNA